MRRAKRAKPSPALLVAAVALVVALGGGAVAGVTSFNKSEKREVKAISKKQAKKLDRKIALKPGPRGPTGARGEAATRLFAYIRDGGAGVAAAIIYGEGVIEVGDPGGGNTYTVTFDQSLVNCVVHATAGVGDPSGVTPLAAGAYIPLVNVAEGTSEQADVTFTDNAGAGVDTSFMVAAFC